MIPTRLEPPAASLRIALIEDNAAFATRLITDLGKEPGFCITAYHPSAEAALADLPKAPPHLVIVDLKLPGMGGVEFIRRIKHMIPDLTCVVLTQFDDSDLLFAALTVGADSYLLKHDHRERIVAGLREARAGGSVMSPSIGRKVLDHFQRPDIPREVRELLSTRQIEILQLARRGKNAKDIAVVLGLSHETVRTHFRNIYRALQVSSLGQAIEKTFL